MLLGQICFINAIKRGETGFLMPFFYTTLIFVILIDFFIFYSVPDRVSFIGASIIIFSAVIVAIRSQTSGQMLLDNLSRNR